MAREGTAVRTAEKTDRTETRASADRAVRTEPKDLPDDGTAAGAMTVGFG